MKDLEKDSPVPAPQGPGRQTQRVQDGARKRTEISKEGPGQREASCGWVWGREDGETGEGQGAGGERTPGWRS